MLKDKYYRQTNVLEAKLGNNPSLIWRGFWVSFELLKEGLSEGLVMGRVSNFEA